MAGIGSIPKAVLRVETTPGSFEIQSRRVRFKMRSETPQMDMEQTIPKMDFDWDSVNAEKGLRMSDDFMRFVRDQAKAATLDAISGIAEDGDYIGDVSKTAPMGEALAEIAKKHNRDKMPEVNSGAVPSKPPKVQWEKGSLTISWSYPDLALEWDKDFMPEINYTAATVDISVTFEERKHFGVGINGERVPGVQGKMVNKEI